ncbi:MAG: hypothetical protein BGO40_02630 [Chryseobacterium sp. 39-10]|nr:signal peptidase [Chryseobacterium sp.]OJV48453.1 MAG: hypothetical protein BGO40_02630 [Chryseobacterium sp. 39-10]
MKISTKFIHLMVVLSGFMAMAQQIPSSPPGGPGDGFPGTPGAPASPIDLYIYLLAIMAMILIFYFGRKYKKQIV